MMLPTPGRGEGRPAYSSFSGDILDFYTSGDVAPGGRFKFSYVSTTDNAGAGGASDTETDADTTEEDKRTESETASAESGECRSGLAGMQWSVLTACAAAMSVSMVLLRRRKKHSRGK